MSSALTQLLESNQRWSEERRHGDKQYFHKLSQGQAPDYLWVGCADSRVPAESLLGLEPGELFVHRNIANQVKVNDANSMSVLQYAVNVLKVKHIIICGHTGCGGVKASLDQQASGYLSDWLEELTTLVGKHSQTLSGLSDEEQWHYMMKANIQSQINLLTSHDLVRSAWQRGQSLSIHGCYFDIAEGRLNDLEITVSAE